MNHCTAKENSDAERDSRKSASIHLMGEVLALYDSPIELLNQCFEGGVI